ncbi:MAG: LLM class flavin-dependent oxidoreductase [Gammaproteobacteria bacterium]|nr:LLM class flavin-dependent oxidoreductase [Gammaproteobacteria bacterium]
MGNNAVMIRPWVFEFTNNPGPIEPERFDPAACAAEFAWYLELWASFEEIGFEGLFFSEHHFAFRSLSPSPNLLIAATAARTRRLRLGTMGNVVPFYEPWRLAEEYAMLDQLSGWRLEIGLASGVGPREFRAVGMKEEEMRPRYTEALDIIEQALTAPRVTHHGRFWHFDGLTIALRPLQRPAPRRWMTGLGLPTAQLAAQRGCCFCTGFLSSERIRTVFEGYRAAVAAAGGQAGAEHLGLRRQVYIGDDAAEARRLSRQKLAGLQAAMAQLPATAGGSVPDAPAERHLVGDDEEISGTPQQVAEQIIEQCRSTGAGHFLAYLFGGYTRAQVTRCYQLWRQVIPALRRAQPGS